MAPLELTLGMADYDRTRALMDGTIRPEGIDLKYVISPPSETFWRMLRFGEFHTSEMSFSTFLISREKGHHWMGIPIFPFRSFFHTSIYVSKKSGIKKPEDLKGKKFAVPEYQVTAALWMRGALEDEFGVKPKDIKWYVERRQNMSHGGETGFKPPEGVSVERLPEGQTMAYLLSEGKIDALMPSPYPGMRSMLNRTDSLRLSTMPGVMPLFSDPVAEGTRYFKKNGFSHINHVVIVRDDVLQKYPWVALNLYKAFQESKEACYARIDRLIRSSLVFAYAYWQKEREIFGGDQYPYGFAKNKKAIEKLIEYSTDQGLTSKKADPESLFTESTLNA